MSHFNFKKNQASKAVTAASPSRIPSLDGLRAVSISLVLLSHLLFKQEKPGFLMWMITRFQLGDLGVSIFFVLSGFLITTLLLKEKSKYQGKIHVRAFYIRRCLRIFPVFYLYAAAVYVLMRLGYVSGNKQDFIRALTYTANLGVNSWALGHVWSLAVEEQFYLFWPWLMKLPRRAMIFAAFFIIFYASAAREIAYHWRFLEPYLFLPFLRGQALLMVGALWGVCLYRYPEHCRGNGFTSHWGRWLCMAVLLTLRFFQFNGMMQSNAFLGKFVLPFGPALNALGIGYLLVTFIAIRDDGCFKFLNHPIVVRMGVLSYSLYIWQQLFLYDKDSVMAQVWWRGFPANLLFTFCAGGLSYYLWERPILKWRDQFKQV